MHNTLYTVFLSHMYLQMISYIWQQQWTILPYYRSIVIPVFDNTGIVDMTILFGIPRSIAILMTVLVTCTDKYLSLVQTTGQTWGRRPLTSIVSRDATNQSHVLSSINPPQWGCYCQSGHPGGQNNNWGFNRPNPHTVLMLPVHNTIEYRDTFSRYLSWHQSVGITQRYLVLA